MAKSSRSSANKENNRRKAAAVFGPAELARQERLSAKLLELAKQPKPEPPEVAMDSKSSRHGPLELSAHAGPSKQRRRRSRARQERWRRCR